MKKLIYLTSILALSACVSPAPQVIIQQIPTPNTPNNSGTQQPGNNNNQNPGNGTQDPGNGSQDPGNTPLTPEQQEIKESNEKITGLFYGKDMNGNDLKLDTIKFETRSDLHHYYGEKDRYSFDLDKDGKITGLKYIYYDNQEIVKRERDSNKFLIYDHKLFRFDGSQAGIKLLENVDITFDTLERLKLVLAAYVYKYNYDHRDKEETIKQIDKLTSKSNGIDKINGNLTITVNMYGKEIGLKYSDFGMLERNFKDGNDRRGNDFSDVNVIRSGYKEKEIKRSDIQENTLTFKGKAVGAIANYKYNNFFNTSVIKSLDLVDNNATLTFDKNSSEKETLNMSFSNWYDVKVEKDKHDSSAKLTFTNPNNNTIDENFKLGTNSNSIVRYGTLKTQYYGDDKTKPSEVVGEVGYGEIGCYTGCKGFGALFGGIKQ